MWFRCLIRGENFSGEIAVAAPLVESANPVTTTDTVGFFVTRCVEANSTQEAEKNAVDLLRSEPRFNPTEGYTPTGKERVFVEKITEVAAEDSSKSESGFAFFPSETNSE